ncbi:MAG: hypothetical protein QOC98_1167 [Frankiaceae bacterium]|jgi:hypothetical protein|nr:hypothetical protein [Frankiaceae bacterium]
MPVPGAPVPSPVPGDTPALDDVPALDEARARLVALDEVALEQHAEQFTAIDRLLRSALDGTDRALSS